MRNLLDSFFKLSSKNTTPKQEILAGTSTFATMAYILFIYPLVLSQTGMEMGAIMTALALTTALATFTMGLFANYPFALAPSMGMNAYLTYSVVLSQGHSWQIGLGACFLAGILLLFFNLVGLRKMLLHAIPQSLRIGVTCGIGLFLATIGLKYLGIIAPNPNTCVTVGNLYSIEALLGGVGLLLMSGLYMRGFKGAILISILTLWGVGLLFGLVKWQGLVALPPSITPTFLQLDILSSFNPALAPTILSIIFVAIFEATGSLVALAEQGGFFSDKGKLDNAKAALYPDAIGTTMGTLLGTGPVTNYLESASGIAAGGRTGLTSVTVAILFLSSLFFAPLVQSLPHFSTAPALIFLGAFLLRSIQKLNWTDPSEYIPAFAVILLIPLTMNIAVGIAIGFVLYTAMKALSGSGKEVHPMIWILSLILLLSTIYQTI